VCRTLGHGEHRDNWLQQTCHSGGEARHEGVLRWCECRVIWQTDGATPLLTASYNGHVECVRTLLGKGAVIDQAMVGRACSMARHRGGLCVWGRVGDCVYACICSWLLEGFGKR
jgi:hypothetical protein